MRRHFETVVFLVVLATCLICCRCNPQPLPPEPPVVVVGGADSGDPCVTGCANLAALPCPAYANAAACAERCHFAAGKAQWATNNVGPVCWAKATTSTAAQACPGIDPGDCHP